jgi:hypothetical protein
MTRTTLEVTAAGVAPHHFAPGTAVRFERVSRAGDRYLVRGPSQHGESIRQWLAAEDLAAVAPTYRKVAGHRLAFEAPALSGGSGHYAWSARYTCSCGDSGYGQGPLPAAAAANAVVVANEDHLDLRGSGTARIAGLVADAIGGRA